MTLTNQTPIGVLVITIDGEERSSEETLSTIKALVADPVSNQRGWRPGDKRDLRLVTVKVSGTTRAAIKCGGCGECDDGNGYAGAEAYNESDGPGSGCSLAILAASIEGCALTWFAADEVSAYGA
jgi:hypothetical protein